MSIGELGHKLTVEEVAALFEVAPSTVKRKPSRFGGVKMGRRALFFEKNVVRAVEESFAVQVQAQRHMDRAMDGASESRREPPPKIVRLQDRGQGLGGRRKKANQKAELDDPHGLLP